MSYFYFDIETIPSQLPGVRDEIAAGITAPAQYKKADSIAEWLRDNRDAETEREWLKTSFDGGSGHSVVIGFAIDDGPTYAYDVARYGDAADERGMLWDFFSAVTEAGSGVKFVGHNVIGFDFPFLWKRAMILGVKPPLNFPRNPKPWSDAVDDTMLLWDPTQRAGGSMARICKLMGIPGKGDIGGADVWPLVKAGRISEVREYCKGDVERTRAMHKRMIFA